MSHNVTIKWIKSVAKWFLNGELVRSKGFGRISFDIQKMMQSYLHPFIRFKSKISIALNSISKRHVLVAFMSLKTSPGVMFGLTNFQFLEFAIWRRIKPFFSETPLTKSSVNQLLLPNFLLALRHSSQKTCKITQKEKDSITLLLGNLI